MKDVKDNLCDDVEPTVRQGATFLPMWLIGLLCVMVCWGFNYVSAHDGDYHELVYEPYASTNQLAGMLPQDEVMSAMKQGLALYGVNCAGCHQANGMGNAGQAPPLAGSEWVNAASPNRIIRIPLRGLKDPIKVKGIEWNLNMFAAGAAMSDEQIAAVLTYVRKSWGNKGSLVTPEQVAKVRAEIADHADQFTAAELEKTPEGP